MDHRTIVSFFTCQLVWVNRYMGMEKVEISAALENEASRAVCERLGMTQEGITRRAERLADRVVDHVHYGLLRDDWLRLRERDH